MLKFFSKEIKRNSEVFKEVRSEGIFSLIELIDLREVKNVLVLTKRFGKIIDSWEQFSWIHLLIKESWSGSVISLFLEFIF